MTASVTKVNTVKRLISALLVLLLLAGMIIPVLGSVGTDAYVNDDEVNVRTGPGTGYSSVYFNGSDAIQLNKGQYVRVIAVQRGSDGYDWYQIVFVYKGYTKVGYMRSDFVTYIGDDRAYCKYLDEQGFPKSYQPYLRALYAASGGKWTFVPYKTGLDWTKSLENESTLGRSLISGYYDAAQRSTAPGAYDSSTGVWVEFEPGWYAASRDTVAYYMDPRSYLVNGTCVAFEKLSGGENATHAQIKKVLADCVWATDEIIDEFIKTGSKEELEKQKQADIQRLRSEGNTSAANALEKVTVTGVSPIFLAVKARGEIGTGATKNATGYPLSDGKKYYNFFNIGAYGGSDPNYNGILYAQSKGWDTTYKALLGGAWFIFRNYIEDGQDTTFLQRFNFTPLYTYSYQYATDITYAYKWGGWQTYEAYAKNGLTDTELTFSVPILENMPAVTKLPTARYEDEYVDPEPEPEPDPTPETYTLTVKGGTFTYNGGEAMTSANVPVDAEVKVTLNQSAVPEGMVFDLWAMDEASLLGNPAVAYNQESFTIPAGSVAKDSTVTVEAQYRDATIESEPSILGTAAIIGVAGAGTAVIVWQGYRIGMELYEKYFQPTPEETAAEQPAPEAPAAAAS